MKYVTSVERRALQRGILQKAKKDVVTALELRLKPVPKGLIDFISKLADESHLEELHKQAILCGSIEEFEQFIETALQLDGDDRQAWNAYHEASN